MYLISGSLALVRTEVGVIERTSHVSNMILSRRVQLFVMSQMIKILGNMKVELEVGTHSLY